MPKKKKRPHEMTNDELARFVFPKEVAEEAKRIAHAGEKNEPKKRTPKSS